MTQNYIGVDLSADHLDICDPIRGTQQLANTSTAIRRFLAGLGTSDFVVFEATSGCDGLLLAEAERTDVAHTRLNPARAWHFARSLGLAKTDRVDAAMLARFGAERQPEADAARDPARVELAVLTRRRDQLKRMQVQEKNRRTDDLPAAVRGDIDAVLRVFARHVVRIEKAIAVLLRAHPELDAQARLLRSVPGFGPVVTSEILAHLPELGTCDRRAIASLAGLAPKARDSGKFRGKRFVGDGRRQVRKALYMAALNALRLPTPFNAMAERMREAGKPGKVIVIAIARKLITIANALLRNQTPFKAGETAGG